MLQQAINTYDEVVSLPNVPSDLIKLSLKREADRQQFLGKEKKSQKLSEQGFQDITKDLKVTIPLNF